MNEQLNVFAKRLPIDEGQLHLLCPAGAGDVLWVLSKIMNVSAVRPITFWFPAEEQRRAGDLCQMWGLRYGYLPGLTTNWIWAQKGDPDIPDAGGVLACHANRHLETGKRLDRWYPELPFINPAPEPNVALYKTEVGNPKYVTIHMCHEGYMEGNLLTGMWARMLKRIEQEIAPVLIVGAGQDVAFAQKVCENFDPTLTPIFNAPYDHVAVALKHAVAHVGVASGVGILAAYYGVPTHMGYPHWLKQMPGMWEHEGAKSTWSYADELETGWKGVLSFL